MDAETSIKTFFWKDTRSKVLRRNKFLSLFFPLLLYTPVFAV